MCRFLVYKGRDEIVLSKLILEPQHSILTQSYDSRLRLDRRRPHNADGFGLGYYTSPDLSLGPDPCIFTSTTPAWSNNNLARLARKTSSALIFAHVRATTQGSLSDNNCHPFSHKSLMFMHNGNVAGWRDGVKRKLAVSIGERWFSLVEGGTDSEYAFALFLDSLAISGHDPDDEHLTQKGFGHAVLRAAMLQTISRLNAFVKETATTSSSPSSDTRSLLNFAVTDGKSVICTRYVSSRTDEAASLYFSSGTNWKKRREEETTASTADADADADTTPGSQGQEVEEFRMERRDRGADIVLIASEPLTFERDNWVTVPTNSTITIHNKQTVLIHPIIDEFYNHSPSYQRSSGFAHSQGLASDAPGDASAQQQARARSNDIGIDGSALDGGLEEKLREVEVGG